MSDSATNSEKYYLEMGVLTGSVLTYFLYANAHIYIWVTAWVIIFLYGVYHAFNS